jgi:hypothetical protein
MLRFIFHFAAKLQTKFTARFPGRMANPVLSLFFMLATLARKLKTMNRLQHSQPVRTDH